MSRAARGKFLAFLTTQTPPRASVRSRDSIRDTTSFRAARCLVRVYQAGGRRGSLSSICTTAPVRTASASDAFALLRGVSTWVKTTSSSSLSSSRVTGRRCAARASAVARTLTKSMPTNFAAVRTRSTMGLLASMPSSPQTSSTSTDVEAMLVCCRAGGVPVAAARADGLAAFTGTGGYGTRRWAAFTARIKDQRLQKIIELACIDTLGIRKPAKAAYLRTKSIIQLSKERRAISETHRCSVVTLLSRSTPT